MGVGYRVFNGNGPSKDALPVPNPAFPSLQVKYQIPVCIDPPCETQPCHNLLCSHSWVILTSTALSGPSGGLLQLLIDGNDALTVELISLEGTKPVHTVCDGFVDRVKHACDGLELEGERRQQRSQHQGQRDCSCPEGHRAILVSELDLNC